MKIGGVDQWIEIRAWSADKPVLLSIPGGPGQSDLAVSRPSLGELAKDFVVVSWDQRGIGKSYPPSIQRRSPLSEPSPTRSSSLTTFAIASTSERSTSSASQAEA